MWISIRLRATQPPVDGHVDWAHIICRWKYWQRAVICRMNRDFIVFICEHYPQVANILFEFGTILTVEDDKENENEYQTVVLQQKFVLNRDQRVGLPPTTHMNEFVE